MTSKLPDFVNRDEALTHLRQLAGIGSEKRVLVVTGPSGIGKSYLLKEFQAECEANKIACALLNFADTPGFSYWDLLIELWKQLAVGTEHELIQLLAKPFEFNTQLLTVPLKSVRTDAGNDTNLVNSSVTATIGDVGANAQIAIGQNITIQNIVAQFAHEDGRFQTLVQKTVAEQLRNRLVTLAKSARVVILIDSWDRERITGELGEWIRHYFLEWVLDDSLPNTVAVIAGRDEPELLNSLPYIDWLPLAELSEEAVHRFWVGVNGLPSSDVPTINQVVHGLPLALALTAKRYMQEGKSHLDLEAQDVKTTSHHLAVQQAVEGYLASLSEALSDIVRLAAIPHWFDEELLAHLLTALDEKRMAVGQVIKELQHIPFARWNAKGRFTFDDGVRDYLLQRWQLQSDHRFEIANRCALDHFQAFAKSKDVEERFLYESEITYHFLLADEREGLNYLRDRFEEAYGRYQFAISDTLVQQAKQVADRLSDRGNTWVQYYEARLDLAYRRKDLGESIFRDLADRSPDPVLRAVSTWALGQICIHGHNWSEAIRLLRKSLADLEREGVSSYIARVMLSIGNTYESLASYSGGLQSGGDSERSRIARLPHLVQHLPFLGWEWLVRRVRFLPYWNFGTNYQDWIVSHLLREARMWYRRAQRQIRNAKDFGNSIEVQVSLADLNQQLGRWARAKSEYAALAQNAEVRESTYWSARVQLGQGKSSLDRGDFDDADRCLSNAFLAFRSIDDAPSLGNTASLLGRTYLQQSQIDKAISYYAESLRAYNKVDYSFESTKTIWALEAMLNATDLSQDQKSKINKLTSGLLDRRYVVRFPGKLLALFRRFAVLLLPLTYFVIPFVLVILLAGVTAGMIEGETDLGSASIVIVLEALKIVIVSLFALWSYRLFYTILGSVAIHFLGRRLVTIEKEQPVSLTVDTEGIHLYAPSGEISANVLWNDIQSVTLADYRQVFQPLELVSAIALKSSSSSRLILRGVTSGYSYLKEDIRRRLEGKNETETQHDISFTFFDRRWTMAVAIVAVAVALIAMLTGSFRSAYEGGPHEPVKVTIGGQPQLRPELTVDLSVSVSTFVFVFAITVLLVLPAIILSRLVYRQFIVLRPFGHDLSILPDWLLVLSTAAFILIAVVWIGGLLIPTGAP